MDNIDEQVNLNQFPKILKEIAGYVTTILVYILAVVGYPTPPFSAYSATISVLTVSISFIVLWLWRWPQIIRKKSIESTVKILTLETKKPVKSSPIHSLLALFQPSQSWLFNMPLAQRYFEITFLVLLICVAIIMIGSKFTTMNEEISGFYCINKVTNVPRIVIFDFDPSNASQFDESLANVMTLQAGDNIQVCKYNRKAKDIVEAGEIGSQYRATLVISGNSANGVVEVYLNTIDLDMFNQRKDGISVKDGLGDTALLVQITLAEVLFTQEKFIDAQKRLSAALETAEFKNIANTSPTLLASGYFSLALFFDDEQMTGTHTDINQAIWAYSKVIALEPDFGSAYLNRALLYKEKGDIEKALSDYAILMSKKSGNDFIVGCLTHGEIYMDLKKYLEAISDFKAGLQDPNVATTPFYQYLIYDLGKAYLLQGEYQIAKNTYQMLPILSPEDADDFISDLHTIKADPNKPEAEEAITNLIDIIQKQQSP